VSSLLVVEDDPTVADVVTRYLEREGFEVTWCADGAEGLQRALDTQPDLVVLDVMLPSLDGFEVCRRLRSTTPIPVIMLTARGEEVDRVLGLEFGADDYMAKPFSPRELTARVKAVLRRAAGPLAEPRSPRVIRSSDLVVDTAAREVTLDERAISLTALEFDLLVHLMTYPRETFRREQLMDAVWGSRFGDPSTVTVHIRRLREKVEADARSPKRIVTVWGVGYRWDG
jgi:DNA-binding response OmpR family regulator